MLKVGIIELGRLRSVANILRDNKILLQHEQELRLFLTIGVVSNLTKKEMWKLSLQMMFQEF